MRKSLRGNKEESKLVVEGRRNSQSDENKRPQRVQFQAILCGNGRHLLGIKFALFCWLQGPAESKGLESHCHFGSSVDLFCNVL